MKDVKKMTFEELEIEEHVDDMLQWEAYKEGDLGRCNDLWDRLIAVRDELDLRIGEMPEPEFIFDESEVETF